MKLFRPAVSSVYRRARVAGQRIFGSVLIMCCTAAASAGAILWWVAAHHTKEGREKMVLTVLEHGASALIVAAFMGLTYEFLLHRARKREEREWAVNAISNVAPLMPAAIFDLVKDIATRSIHFPTLFKPIRSDQELLLVQDLGPFEQLLHVAAFRRDEGPIIRSWLASDDVRLRFLASDMIGLCRWRAFTEELHAAANEALQKQPDISDTELCWALNYKWAASRSEDPAYSSLGRMLLETSNEAIQKWILWVPVQVPDEEWSEIVATFVKRRRATCSRNVLQIALAAIDRLDERVAQKNVLRKHADVFTKAGLTEEYRLTRARVEARTWGDRRRHRRQAMERRTLCSPMTSA